MGLCIPFLPSKPACTGQNSCSGRGTTVQPGCQNDRLIQRARNKGGLKKTSLLKKERWLLYSPWLNINIILHFLFWGSICKYIHPRYFYIIICNQFIYIINIINIYIYNQYCEIYTFRCACGNPITLWFRSRGRLREPWVGCGHSLSHRISFGGVKTGCAAVLWLVQGTTEAGLPIKVSLVLGTPIWNW